MKGGKDLEIVTLVRHQMKTELQFPHGLVWKKMMKNSAALLRNLSFGSQNLLLGTCWCWFKKRFGCLRLLESCRSSSSIRRS